VLSQRTVHPSFDQTFPFYVPLLVVIWSYPGQGYNSVTGHFVWLARSPGTLDNFQKHAQDIFSHVLTSLTNRVRASERVSE